MTTGRIETVSEGDFDLEETRTWCESCGRSKTFLPWLHRYGFRVVEFDKLRYIRLVRARIFCFACNRDTWHSAKCQTPRPPAAET